MEVDCNSIKSNSLVISVTFQVLNSCMWLLVSTQQSTDIHHVSHWGKLRRALNLNLEKKIMTIHEASEGSGGRDCPLES